MMSSLRSRGGWGGGVGAAAALALLLASTPSASARGGDRVDLDPSSLHRGADPGVVYLVRDTIRDGRLRVPATRRGHHERLWVVAGGYVVDDRVGPRDLHRLVFIDRSGSRRVIARRLDPLGTAVSPDRRLIGWSRAVGTGARPAPPSMVTVARPRTGHVLASRRFHWATVLGVSGRRVLLDRMDAKGHSTTWWWNYRRDSMRRVVRQPGIRADLAHRRLVLGVGSPDSFCRRVAPLDRPRRTLWRSCPWSPRAWSPDGTRTLSTYNYFDDTGTPLWDIRADQTGRRLLRLTGRLDWTSAWEDSRHVLVIAQGDDGNAAIVRCSVGGRCERASRLWDMGRPDYLPNYIAPPVVLPAN